MSSVATDTIGGFNHFLKDQQEAPGTATLSLHQFDDVFETLIDAKDVRRAKPLTSKTFTPRGSTALLDAIGKAIDGTGQRLAQLPEHERAEKVIFVIITDGFENASHRFTLRLIHSMISHQREKYGWEFVFLCANQDAIAAGQSLGVSPDNSMKFAHTGETVCTAFAATSSNLVGLRSHTAESLSYSAQQRAEADPE